MSNKTISLLKEHRDGEQRVLLLPDAIPEFVKRGYRVLVESTAGILSGYTDEDYLNFEAEIVDRDEAWNMSNVVFKYKAPTPDEYHFFRPDMHLACFMHAEGDLKMTEAMRSSGMSAYALEFFCTQRGDFPTTTSDNEISGKLAVLMGSYYLQIHMGGRGILLSAVPGAPKSKVVIIGYGNVGGSAARLAASMGAEVTVFGTRWEGLRQFMASVPANVRCKENTIDDLETAVLEADLVIGAILVSTHDTPPMLSEELVKRMKKGSVIVDVTCGYGSGYMPSFTELTTHEKPFYERHGVLHCKIDAMPASVPKTSSHATSSNVWRYLLSLAQDVYDGKVDQTSRNGKIVASGEITHDEIMRHITMAKRMSYDGV